MTDDQRARGRFQFEIENNFSVVASAGAGKTTAIVNRIVTIAETDLNRLPKLVVVTYTNSAARAFKRRARDLLLKKVPTHPHLILTALEQAFFGTIHSFCLRLLRDYQNEAGLPDALNTITDQARTALWESFVASDEADQKIRSMPVARQLLRFCTLDDLLRLARNAEPVFFDFERELPMIDFAAVRNCQLRAHMIPRQQKVLGQLEDYWDSVQTGTGYVGLPVLETGSGKLLRAGALALHPLIEWIELAALKVAGELATAFKGRCLKRGLLSFNDQINLCRALMQNQHVADDVRAREFSVILDEAQDTQGVMFETLIEAVRPPGSVFGTWPGLGAPPRPGDFSMVGDPRQTIYDERAGLAVYTAVNSAFAERKGGELLDMSVTWRCAVGVVDAVNHLFGGQTDPISHVKYDDLSAAPAARPGSAGYFALDLTAKSGVNEVFREECRQIARWLAAVGPSGLGITSWTQVAILGQTHQWLAICGQELKKQKVPFSFFKKKIPFHRQPGFAWPVALLYTVLKPWDQFERIGVLRNIFCIPDVSLARWVRAEHPDDAELKEALALLAEFENLIKSGASLSVVISEILRESRIKNRLLFLNEDLKPVEEFFRRVYEAEASGKSLFDLIAELLEALIEEAELPAAQEDHLELITCHSSKGLEWEVVIPIGVDRPSSSGRNAVYPRLFETPGGQHIIWNNQSRRIETAGAQANSQAERSRRLFYVTLTRARKGLVIPFAGGFYAKNAGSFAALLPMQPDTLPGIRTPLLERETPAPQEPMIYVTDSNVASPQVLAPLPELIRPHALARDQDRVENFQAAESALGGYNYGRWWHGWIEKYPWAGSELERYGHTQTLTLEVLPAFADRAEREVALLRASSDLAELQKAGRIFRTEMPFSYPESRDRWIEGVMDLVVLTSNKEIWIVDWKTNQRLLDEPEELFALRLRKQYLPQLQAYRGVIENGLHRPVRRLLLYSTVLGKFA